MSLFKSPRASSNSTSDAPAIVAWPTLQSRKSQFIGYLILTAIHLLLIFTPFIQRLEFVLLDTFFRARPTLEMSPQIVIVEVAQDSVQKIGRWPWPRRYHAALLAILKEWRVHAVVFDAFFSEPSADPFDDGAFAQALAENKNVYAGTVIEDSSMKQTSQDSATRSWVQSIPLIRDHLKGEGHVNVSPDLDGVTRRVALEKTLRGESHRYLGVEVAESLAQQPDDRAMQKKYPLDQNGYMLINWVGRWEKTFRHFSYWDVLQSYAQIKKGEKPIVSPNDLKDKVVLIGATASGLTDIKGVPVQSVYPGVGVIANIMNSIMTGQFVREASQKENALTLLLIAFCIGFCFWNSNRILTWTGALVMALAWLGFSFVLFWKAGIFMNVVNPLLLIFSFFIFSVLIDFLRSQNEQSMLYQLATRDGLTGLYVIRHMRTLISQAHEWALKKEQSMAVLMTDIDFFKKVNDEFGHDAGDLILKDTARLIELELTAKNNAGRRILVGRYGGEEFIVLIEDCDAETAARHYAEAVRRHVESFQFRYQGRPISVTLSLGVAELEPGEKNMDEAIKRADIGLYRAKKSGRNQVQVVRGSDPLLLLSKKH